MALIHEQIPKIMGSIGAIGKDRKNEQQKYQFRGIDDLYNACNTALSEHGVFSVPTVEHISREERNTKSGGTLMYTVLTVRYSFFASDGSSIEAVTIGEAMDSGDKSCNKAMSAAQKYAFLQVFSIPTEEPKDTENETHSPTPKVSMFERARVEFSKIDALPHLANHWNKHQTEYKSSPDFAEIVKLKDLRKAELQAKLNATGEMK